MMLRVGIWLLVLCLTGCSTWPESWNFNYAVSPQESVPQKQMKKTFEAATSIKAPLIDVGLSKTEVLDMLGSDIRIDKGISPAEQYVKSGEIYDVFYFREQVKGRSAVRAYLFKDDILIGIGLSDLE